MATSGAGKPYALKCQIGPDPERLVQLLSRYNREGNIGAGRLIDLASDGQTR